MSAAVMSPTPALPQLRKSSVWEKMFGGFKLGNKRDEDDYEPTEPSYESVSFPAQRVRHMSTSTGMEMDTVRTYKRNGSTATKASAVEPSFISSKSRNASVSSLSSRRSSRSTKWWRSSNPENAPPVPTIDNRFFGSHNPDIDSIDPSAAPAPRKASYVPRNAAGSFLKSTTTQAMRKSSTHNAADETAETSTQHSLNEATRKLSTADNTVPQASLKPIQIKTIDLRKDSHVSPEKHNLHSMAGVCDIIEEQATPENEVAVSPTSHKRADTPTRQSVERTDSADASPELEALKIDSHEDSSRIAPIAV